jgi:hypothetical protein
MKRLEGANSQIVQASSGLTVLPIDQVCLELTLRGTKALTLQIRKRDYDTFFVDELNRIRERDKPVASINIYWDHYGESCALTLENIRQIFTEIGFDSVYGDFFARAPESLRKHLQSFGRQKSYEMLVTEQPLILGTLLDRKHTPQELVLYTTNRKGEVHIIDGVHIREWWQADGTPYNMIAWRRESIGRYWFHELHLTNRNPANHETLAELKKQLTCMGFIENLPDALVPFGGGDQ